MNWDIVNLTISSQITINGDSITSEKAENKFFEEKNNQNIDHNALENDNLAKSSVENHSDDLITNDVDNITSDKAKNKLSERKNLDNIIDNKKDHTNIKSEQKNSTDIGSVDQKSTSGQFWLSENHGAEKLGTSSVFSYVSDILDEYPVHILTAILLASWYTYLCSRRN